ncbi:MAG: PD-(D/E)XK nuclease family protein, partial [Bacteroidetes bacterium]
AFGFLESLMKLAESEAEGTYSSMEYIKFLLHPYVKNIRLGTRSDITRIIMHTIEEYLAECGIVHVSLESLEQDDALLASIHKRTARVDETITREHIREHIEEIHLNTLKKFKTFPTIGECARSAREIFLYIFTRSTAYLHPYFRPYVERLTDALDSVASSLLAEQRFTEQAGYFSFLRHFLATESVPFSGTPLKGVQVLGLLETRNLSFDTLYMLDVNDDIVPGKPEADLLLPQQVRARLGLETYRDREKLVEYYFNLAVANANTVYFFYTSSASGKQEKSRFVEKLLWQMQQRDCTISAEPYERIAKYRVHLANAHPQEIPKTGEMVRWMKQQLQLSATALDTYTTCQIKFYYRHVFHLDVKDEVSDANDASVVGKIVHKALFEYFEPYTGKTLAKEMLTQERLQEVVDSCFTNQFGANATGMNMLFKEQVAEHLWKFLERYQIPLVEREQITIMALERSLQVEKWGVTLKGTIDRIEMRGTHVHILDYKTTSDEKALCIRLDRLIPDDSSTWQDAIQSFQLPMYMLLYNEMTDRGTEHITPAYLFLGRTTIDGEIEGGIGNEHESAGTVYRAIEKVIFNMIQEILDPNHAFLPASHIEKQCPACPYHVMCGTQWTGVHRKF